MALNVCGRRARIRLANRDSISRRTSRSWRTWLGSAARSRASLVSRARRTASPRTNVSASAASVASSLVVHGAAMSGRRALPALGRPRLAAERAVLAVAHGVVGLDERVQLARSLVDDGRLGVAQVALDGELVRVAVGAMDLDRVKGALHRVLGRVPLRQRRLARVPTA